MASAPRPVRSGAHASRRRRALRSAAAQVRTDSLLVTSPTDVRYLTGFTGADSFLLLHPGGASLITDGRYDQQARAECPDVRLFVRRGSIWKAVAEAARASRRRRLAVQAEHVTLQGRELLSRAGGLGRIVPVKDVVGALRAVKDRDEIAAIRKAVRVAQRAFKAMRAIGARRWIGRSERDLAAELEYRMRLAGADEAAFETIVAVGPHSAMPHYRSGATRVKRGGCVLIDWGARVGGYCSDLTRMVYVGTIPRRFAEIHRAVVRAQQLAVGACRGGVSMSAADKAARESIARAGYGDRFVHGTGHGLGLEVHEQPGLSGKAKGRFRSGMVVTVEPGIYLPGVGGVRIEDDVVITRRGCRRLSSLPRSPQASLLR
ncbi:MAG TPA: Xaa-Pro peptidase family protein [Phycisphaerae bacterium]|nr:Xaa-Pro peptidase family protein [Phycisphaerae bacterium]